MSKRPSFATTIVGKSSLLREGIAKILGSANFRIVASVSSADDLPGKVEADHPLFLIVHSGEDFDFVAGQIEFFRENYPSGRIAIVADRYRPDELVSAFRAGANGCFADVMSCDVFITSLELVMMGETVLPPAFLSYVVGAEEEQLSDQYPGEDDNGTLLVRDIDEPAPQLSPRERLILRCLIEGDSNKLIARKIDIAEATVKVHVKAILRKIRVHNRTQAAIWGMNNGCLSGRSSTIAPALPPGTTKRPILGHRPHLAQLSEPVSVIDQASHSELPRIDRLVGNESDFRARK